MKFGDARGFEKWLRLCRDPSAAHRKRRDASVGMTVGRRNLVAEIERSAGFGGAHSQDSMCHSWRIGVGE
jgi:hypothetical protein